MKVYIGNAFSLGMLESIPTKVKIEEISLEEVKSLLSTGDFISAVGHEATAHLLTSLLKIDISYNRIPIKLQKGDKLIVFQLLVRLEEGKILTEEDIIREIPFKFLLVEIM